MISSACSHTVRRRSAGFSLIEVLIAGMILSVAVLSIVAAQQAFHQQNNVAEHYATALSLANEVREVMLGLPAVDPITGSTFFGAETDESNVTQYDDLDDFDGSGSGVTFSPPINALRQTITDLPGWSQQVTVEPVSPNDISGAAVTSQTGVLRVTVVVSANDNGTMEEVTRLTWLSTAQ